MLKTLSIEGSIVQYNVAKYKEQAEEYIKKSNYTFQESGALNLIKTSNGNISAEELSATLLPSNMSYDVFMSHSHADVLLAEQLKLAIESETGKKVFIDHEVWGNISILQGKLVDKPALDLSAYMNTTSSLVLLLSSAIMEMIAKCSVFLFLSTDNTTNENGRTSSPWLHAELRYSRIIANLPNKGVVFDTGLSMSAESAGLSVSYKLPTKHLTELSDWNSLIKECR